MRFGEGEPLGSKRICFCFHPLSARKDSFPTAALYPFPGFPEPRNADGLVPARAVKKCVKL